MDGGLFLFNGSAQCQELKLLRQSAVLCEHHWGMGRILLSDIEEVRKKLELN